MASVVDTLVTRFVGDSSSHEAAVGRINAANSDLVSGLPNVIEWVGKAAMAYASLNAAIVGVGVAAFNEFAKYDALAKGLEAVEGNARNAANAMRVLRDIAKLPGLGLEEAIKGFSGLRMQGLTAAQSERVLRASGNATALMGGGQEELGRVLMAIRQILSRPNLSGEELNQLAEAGLPAHRILMDAFGTADGGELKKMGVDSRDALEAIVQGLEKMPKAADSAKNSLENLRSAVSLGLASIGEGVAFGVFSSGIKDVTSVLEDLESSGGLKMIGEGIADVIDSLNPFRDNVDGLSESVNEAAAQVYALTQVITGLNTGIGNLFGTIQKWASHPIVGTILRSLPGVGPAFQAADIAGSVQNAYAEEYRARQAAAQAMTGNGLSTFLGSGIGTSLNTAGSVKEEAEKAAKAQDEAKKANTRAVNHLASIEANTRQMVDLQRSILGGGNLGAMGVTPVELSDIRRGGRGGSAEEMIAAGVRKAIIELMGPLQARRGF